jgi:putative phosphoserine phosphatase/1-acylglycerol-3-phosphate O-acyltransferase
MRSFKKGAFHVALATHLPIVPMVIVGAHHAWESRSFRLRRTTVEVTFLPPIDTSAWQADSLDAHIHDVENVFAAALPPEQRPLPPVA